MSAVTDVIADIARIDSIEVTAGNAAPKANPVFTGVVSTAKGANIASATALTLGTDGNYFNVTGVTTITSIATTSHIGTTFKLEFDGILTLTHNATSLILPSGANITTAVGDVAEFVEISSGNFKCVNYERADGTGLVSAAGGAWTLLSTVTATDSATVDIDTTFDSTYDDYIIIGTDIAPSSNQGDMIMLYKIGGEYKSTSTYYRAGSFVQSDATTVSSLYYQSDASALVSLRSPENDAVNSLNFTMKINNPTSVSNRHITRLTVEQYTQPTTRIGEIVNINTTTGALTGIRFSIKSTTIASGTFKLYGIAKS